MPLPKYVSLHHHRAASPRLLPLAQPPSASWRSPTSPITFVPFTTYLTVTVVLSLHHQPYLRPAHLHLCAIQLLHQSCRSPSVQHRDVPLYLAQSKQSAPQATPYLLPNYPAPQGLPLLHLQNIFLCLAQAHHAGHEISAHGAPYSSCTSLTSTSLLLEVDHTCHKKPPSSNSPKHSFNSSHSVGVPCPSLAHNYPPGFQC